MRYWIRFKKQTVGPYTPEQISRQSVATDDTLVCPEGAKSAADWRRLRDVPELVQALRGLATPPSSPPVAAPAPALRNRKDLAKLIIKALGGSFKRK